MAADAYERMTLKSEHLGLLTHSGTLDLSIPNGANTNRVLCIDTGSRAGVALPFADWCRWKETHSDAPLTVETATTPSDGFYVHERTWADRLAIGPLLIRGVPIEQAGPVGLARWGSQYAGTLGLAALKRLDLIVDGPRGLAYWRTREDRPQIPEHNRLGAVFVPTTEHTNQAVARVVQGSPAYEAGMRNGDILIEVDGVKVTSWHSGWLSRFLMPPGTKLRMSFTRNGERFTTTAVLRDIVCPSKFGSK